jgi:Caspase domain
VIALLRTLAFVFGVCASLCTARADEGAPALRRFVLTAAADDGGADRVRLRYAGSDARALRRVLEQLGGVAADDVIALEEPSVLDFQRAFTELGARLEAAHGAGARTELVFFYSGHSDDRGLLLGDQLLGYTELRQALDRMPADVRIAIVDACASGTLIRQKGGARRAPFLFDLSTQVRGHAFLTSSSANEAAQESDFVGGSFFTHYLVSGLRGAADASGDRKVTLTEAYRFAFDETLQRTGSTQAGAQHPAYDIQLAGTGDLVMTDLRSTAAELQIDEALEGRLFVRDQRGTLVAELFKAKNRRVNLALPAGRYALELHVGNERMLAQAEAQAESVVALPASAFRRVSRERTTLRGPRESYEHRVFAASFIPPFNTNTRHRTRPVLNGLDVAVIYDHPEAVEGVQLSLGGVRARHYVEGVQFGLFFNQTYDLRGVQLTAAVNVSRGEAAGWQIGTFNFAERSMQGGQIALTSNYAEDLRGLQTTMGLNVVTAQGVGLQLGSLNFAQRLQGVQIGGINSTRGLVGAAIGAVNVSSGPVRGLQLGAFNYAERADVSLGLIAITKEGGVHAQLSTGDVAVLNGALRFDARYNYSFVSAGYHPMGAPERSAYLLGAGLGAKVPVYRDLVFVDIDLGAHVVQPTGHWYTGLPNSLYQLRVMARVEAHKHFSLFMGPTLNFLLQADPARRVHPGFRLQRFDATEQGSDVRLTYWFGWAIGVRL